MTDPVPLLAVQNLSLPRHLAELQVVQVQGHRMIKRFIRTHHSMLPMPPCTWRLGFALLDQAGNIWGVAIWSRPSARLEDQVFTLELQRMTLMAGLPRNTATFMLAQMRRTVRTQLPGIKRLISYSDPTVHQGTMYRADNWRVVQQTRRAPIDVTRPGRSKGTARTRLVKWERPP